MKKAVIQTGGKQYLVTEGDTISVELIRATEAPHGKIVFEPLLVIDGEATTVGTPTVAKTTVTAEITDEDTKADKVTSVRYKAKKRVHKVRGHRQRQTVLNIVKIG